MRSVTGRAFRWARVTRSRSRYRAYAVAADASIPRDSFKEKTGYDVLLYMAENNKWVKDITIHSLNPVGRADMMRFLKRHAPDGVTFVEKPFVR